MSRRFNRPDFLDLESQSGCRASGLDGRYLAPTEVIPLVVVQQLAPRVRPAVCTRCVLRFDTSFGTKVGGPPWVVLWCGDLGQPIDTRAPLPWLADLPSSSSPLNGGAPPFEMPGTSRMTDAPLAGDPGALRALGAVALVGGGRAFPVGGGGTVADESDSPPEVPGRTPTTGARPPPGAGRLR